MNETTDYSKNNNNNKKKKLRILITGGAGFIGSHMVDKLLSQNENSPTENIVYVMDNCQSSDSLKHLSHHLEKKTSNFFFKQVDITSIEPLLHDFSTLYFGDKERHKFDQIYHMACPASPSWYQIDPVKTLLINVLGTYHMLEIAKSNNARFLITSTSEVYGDPLEHPQSESYWGNVSCTGIRACYDEGKRAAETLCFDYCRTRHVDIRVARIFNTYGPRLRIDDGRIMINFIVEALKGEKGCISIYGSGKQTRSFCFIDDLVNGLYMLMNKEQFDGMTPVNLGNDEEYEVKEIAEKIKSLVPNPQNVKIEYKDLPSDDPRKRKPNIQLAKSLLGWKPVVSLEEGLKRTISDVTKQIGQSG